MGIVSSVRRGIFVPAVLAGLCLLLPPAAAGVEAPVAVRLLAQTQGSVSADEAAALVRSATGGRILDVRLDEDARPPVYRVKVLLEGGRVRTYRVDARTGRIVS